MEGRRDPLPVARRDPVELQRHLDFERLPLITHVGGGLQHVGTGELLLVGDPDGGAARETVEIRLEARQLGGRQRVVGRADEVVLDVGHQSAQRREHARRGGDQHLAHAQFARQEASQHRSGAAERQQREVARVDALARGKLADLAVHAGDRHLDDGLGSLLEPAPELRRDRADGGARLLDVDGHRVITDVAVADDAADGEGVGHGRPRAAAPVAGGTGRRSRALGPDRQDAELADRGDRTAAVADRGHRNGRDVDREVSHHFARAVGRRAVDDDGDIGRGPADVEAQDLVEPGLARDEAGADDTGGRAGEQHLQACRLAELGRHDPAVRLGHHGLGGDAGLLQGRLQGREVARHDRLHVAVDRGRGGALIFANDRPHVAGAEHRHARGPLADQPLGLPFVGRIAIGMQQRQHDPLGAQFDGLVERAAQAGVVERPVHGSVRQYPFPHRQHAVARDQRLGPSRHQVVGIGHLEPRQFQHVDEILRREQAEADALALNHRVDADGGAVREIADVLGVDAEAAPELRQAGNDLAAGLLRRRQYLQCRQAARRFVQGAEIREGAADVHADSIAHRCIPSVVRPMPRAGSRDAG